MDHPSFGSEFNKRLHLLHDSLRTVQPNLDRIAVALVDEVTETLATFTFSSETDSPLIHYGLPLSEVPSLREVADRGTPRLVPDMAVFAASTSAHTRALLQAEFQTSYTVPICCGNRLLGFVFFNSREVNAFSEYILPQLETTAYAISLLVVHERATINTLRATMKSALEVTHIRNPETGEHLRRMAAYCRLIATHLAAELDLTDEYIEHLVLFSSLHDIGKISIPDAVLLKPGKLDSSEFEVMKNHTVRGRALIDALIRNHALESLDHIDILRNIVELHHENWDGRGYPRGLRGAEIPLEARIVAVSDVFDALTSRRVYKEPYPDQQALSMLLGMAGKKLDPRCVDALVSNADEVARIQESSRETVE